MGQAGLGLEFGNSCKQRLQRPLGVFPCGSKAAVVDGTFLLSHLLQDLQVFHGLTASTASRKR